MKDLIFFGIQGSGKGTQGAIAAERLDLKVFETGAALRHIAQGHTALGRKVKVIMDSGNLVTNDIVMKVVEDFLEKRDPGRRVLFDGIPRSLEQKETFDEVLKKYDSDVMGVVIDISDEEAKKRLLGRRVCEHCKKIYSVKYKDHFCKNCGGELHKRSDDNEKAILVRLENFYKETVPVIEEYEKEGKIIRVDGEKPIDDLADEIEKILS
jgi:adenylate kinase